VTKNGKLLWRAANATVEASMRRGSGA
jgi:hypothetical protein